MPGEGQIPELWEDLIPTKRVFDFCRSSLGQRMARALKAGRLFQGAALVMGDSCQRGLSGAGRGRTYSDTGGYRRFFEEEDGVVLVDYKTDRVPRGKAGETLLIQRYKTQMDYYQRAIEQISGKKVKDRILYSVIMDREIHC